MISDLYKKRIAVLRGGPSQEYNSSLITGGHFLNNLKDDYTPIDVLISKNGTWHESGFEKEPLRILEKVDAVINALHGAYGEDGSVQKVFESINIPYSGSSPIPSALCINKPLAKKMVSRSNIKTPCYVTVNKSKNISDINALLYNAMPFPIVVKPSRLGSGIGVSVVNGASDLEQVLNKSFEYSDDLIVEEYIKGIPVTTGVIQDFRNDPHYYLPSTQNLSQTEKAILKEISLKIFDLLNLRDYAGIDFVVHPRRGVYFLEVNTLPKISKESSFTKSLISVGSSVKEFVSHLLGRVLTRK